MMHEGDRNSARVFRSWRRIATGGLLAATGGWLFLSTASATNAPPLEFTSIPLNGDDIVSDPLAVQVQFGFGTRAACKIVEHGDSIALLDRYAWLETPHVNWAKPYARGPVRVLYITGQASGARHPVELMQRSDFEVTVLLVPGVLNDGEEAKQPAVHAWFKDKFRKLMDQPHDVIVLPAGLFEGSPDSVPNYADWILETVAAKVKEGTGLVIRHYARWYRIPERRLAVIHELAPLAHGHGGVSGVPVRADAASPVSESFSLALWPTTSLNKTSKVAEGATVLGTVEGVPFLATGNCGRGRVVSVYYHTKLLVGQLPDVDPEKTPLFGDRHEPIYALLLKAIAWAADRSPRVSMAVPEMTVCRAGEAPSVPVVLKAEADGPAEVELRYRLQDPWGVALHEGVLTAVTGADAAAQTPALPPCRLNGLHRLDLWAMKDGRVENWGSAAIRVEGGVPFGVEALQPAGALDGTARYRIATGGAAGRLHVRALDDMDRVFGERFVDAKDGDTIDIDLQRSCLPRNRVEFSLFDGDDAIGRQYVDLYIPRIGRGSLRNEFVIAAYGSTEAENHLLRFVGALYREAGINSVYMNWHNRNYIRGRNVDLGLFSMTGASWASRQSDLEKELKECPNKPEVQTNRARIIAQAVEDIRAYGGISRVLDDESWFAFTQYKDGAMRGQQACQCGKCLALFRAAMKARYGEIAKLNAAWDTDFKSFEELRVIEEEEILGKDNPSGWLEFRQYMNWTYAQYFKWVNEQHAVLGPDYGAGVGAPHWTSREGGPTYKGGDYSFLKDTLSFMMAYGGPEAGLFSRAFVGQPGGQKYDPPLEWQERGAWYHLLNGADALWYYLGHAIIGSEIAWRKHAEWLRQGTQDIRDGVGLLVSGAAPLNRQVRILYSSENLAMGWLFAKRADAWNALRLREGRFLSEVTLTSLLDDLLFVQPSYVTAEEIQAGDLGDCRLLILPQSLNMDDATAAGIRSFVEAGGRVLADIAPATRQRYGQPRPRSALADVFGVDLSQAAIHKEDEAWYSVGIGVSKDSVDFMTEGTWLPGDLTFLGVTGTTARAQGKMLSKKGRESAVCFLNDFGKGKALLLNFMYRDLDNETVGWHRLFGDALAAWAGLEPPARIVDPYGEVPLAYRPLRAFQRGGLTLLGSIRGRFVWSGGKPIHVDSSRALDTSDAARFVWKGKKHVYNVRTREYLGFAESADVDLPSYRGRLLALLPYQVEALDVEAPASASAGTLMKLTATVRADAAPGEHVLRLMVASPTGYRNPLYDRTAVTRDGKAEFEIPFADNDRRGEWTVRVRDAMTGVEGAAAIKVQ